MTTKDFDLPLFKRRTLQCIRKDLAFSRLILETTTKEMSNSEHNEADVWLLDLEDDIYNAITEAQLK